MKLKKGQILNIKTEQYAVVNMIEYKENTWIWQEYEIKRVDSFKHKWLLVEKDENNKIQYYLYDRYIGKIDINEIEFQSENITYELYEKGTATVLNFFGNVDVDKYEKCEYFDYKSKDGKNIISVEKWENETDKSIGMQIEETNIVITDKIDEAYTSKSNNKGKQKNNAIGMIILFFIILIPMILQIFSGLFVNKSIQKYLKKKTEKYQYETSITNNTNNQKAKVYVSKFETIDKTVKDIIDGVPEGITKVTSENAEKEEGIGLQTKNEYAYVYKENQKIYIQVSNKKYLNNSGTMYHSHHYHHYYSSFNGNRLHSTYNNYAYSARQKSVNSRTASGGGTSSGK